MKLLEQQSLREPHTCRKPEREKAKNAKRVERTETHTHTQTDTHAHTEKDTHTHIRK